MAYSIWFRKFRRAILRWYDANGRSLPWRETRDPYAIWVSEIMLQQTQVATVLGYYERFLGKFPNLRSLALADEPEVLALWSGLGYYRRARQMHSAAKIIVSSGCGEFPREFDDILALPGVGRYTAGAIASFAYDDHRPVLEANTIRLFSRLIGLQDDPASTSSQAKLWEFAETILPSKRSASRPSTVNQAVMELGSQICTSKHPACHKCPLADLCRAYEQGLQKEIPWRKPKQLITEETHALVIIRHRKRYLMRLNESGGWWQGLWDFPRTRIETVDRTYDKIGTKKPPTKKQLEAVEASIEAVLGLQCVAQQWTRTMRHSVTRYRITLHCFEATVPPGFRADRQRGVWKWMSDNPEVEFPMTSTALKLHLWLKR